MSIRLVSKLKRNNTFCHTMFESNPFINIQIYTNIKVFLMQSVKQQLFPLLHKSYSKQSQDVQLELLQHHIKYHPDQMICGGENEANMFYFDLVTPRQSQGTQKWHKLVKSMTPISMAGMIKFGWTVCMLCPTLKTLPSKLTGQLTEHDSLHIYPSDTHTDKKNTTKKLPY